MRNTFIEEDATKEALAKFVRNATKLSMGEKCAEFEREFAKRQGAKHAVLFNSGGSANLAIMQALKNLGILKHGDTVGFSALTWSTNVMPIIQMGFKAVPIDCDPRLLNCTSKTAMKELVIHKCKAFFITNALGFAGDLHKIKSECKKKGIVFLEDNCEALGTELKHGRTGNFGLAASFSFFVAHHMSTIEGGMATTNNRRLSDMLRIVRANGWDRNLHPKSQDKIRKTHGIASEFDSKYTFYDLGFNMRPTEITGFLGLFQLKHFDKTIPMREKNFNLVHAATKRNGDFIVLDRSHIKTLSSFALPFVCKSPELRRKYIKLFEKAGIEVRPMIAGNIQRQPFAKKHIGTNLPLHGAEFLHHSSFYCGNCPDYTDKEISVILDCLKKR